MKILVGDASHGASEAGWHSIESFLTCPKEFQLQHIRKIVVPRAETPDHFAVGTLVHAGRAKWFERGFKTSAKTWDKIKEAVQQSAEAHKFPVSLKAEQLALDILTQYIEHWSMRPHPKPIAVEHKLGPAPIAKDDPFYLFRTSRLDDLSEYEEAGCKLAIGELKTSSQSLNDMEKEYKLHGQPMLCQALYRFAKEGQLAHGRIDGIVLDCIQKGYGGERHKFARFFVETPEHALGWFVKDMRSYMRGAAAVDWDADVTHNIKSCTRMIGRGRIPCQYRELCTNGRAASILYKMADGSDLSAHKPEAGRMKMPWE